MQRVENKNKVAEGYSSAIESDRSTSRTTNFSSTAPSSSTSVCPPTLPMAMSHTSNGITGHWCAKHTPAHTPAHSSGKHSTGKHSTEKETTEKYNNKK